MLRGSIPRPPKTRARQLRFLLHAPAEIGIKKLLNVAVENTADVARTVYPEANSTASRGLTLELPDTRGARRYLRDAITEENENFLCRDERLDVM